MPTYDYECQACGHRFERFQEMTARKLRTCPECKKRKLIRLVGTGAGVIFKGSGFYETDYKRASASKSGQSDATAKGETAGKPEKTETAKESPAKTATGTEGKK